MPNYELGVILDPYLTDADYETEIEKVKEQLTKRGAEIGNVDVWGRRRLAYPIAKKVEGYYVFISFTGSIAGAELADLEQQLRVNERLIRELIIRGSERKKPRRKPKKPRVVSETFSAGAAGAAGAQPNNRGNF